MIIGVTALIFAVVNKSLVILLVASILAGILQSLAFMGSLADVSQIAPADRKGDIVATYYVVVYVATALPAVGVGILSDLGSLSNAFLISSYAVIGICATGLVGLTVELHARSAGRNSTT